MPAPKRPPPFNFDEFYRAFSKSVAADVVFANGDVHIVQQQQQQTSSLTSDASAGTSGRRRRHASDRETESCNADAAQSPALSDRAAALDGPPLPAHIAALAALQEADGSWKYSPEFAFVLNSVAPAPPEGIAGKTWATCICVSVWRQSPECFGQLDASYQKALLHCDDNVLRRVRSLIDFGSLHNIRKYNNDEARALRERLAQEAAAKRVLEEAEDRRLAQEREELTLIMEMSVERAQRLPRATQQIMVEGLRNDIRDVFEPAGAALSLRSSSFQSGDVVECCWRRLCRAARASRQESWHPCTITAVQSEHKSVHVQFLDGDCERERSVALKYVRRRPDDERALRDAEFERLQATWKQPIVCAAEVARLEELQAKRRRSQPWNGSTSLPALVKVSDPSRSITHTALSTEPSVQQQHQQHQRLNRLELTFSAGNRAAATLRVSSASSRSSDTQQDALYQEAFTALVAYERAYSVVRDAIKSCAHKYATAILFTERFHAFDAFRDALVALMHCTVDALERIAQWKQYTRVSKNAAAGASPIFVWNGSNFALTLSRSLDVLARSRELIEWYGDEFPLEMNPFMLSKSLVDRAEDMGLELTVATVKATYSLRAALRLHKNDVTASAPAWWPEAKYDDALLARIARAETFVIQELPAANVLAKSQHD